MEAGASVWVEEVGWESREGRGRFVPALHTPTFLQKKVRISGVRELAVVAVKASHHFTTSVTMEMVFPHME